MSNSEINLKDEQAKTLNTSRRKYGLLAKILFFSMDLFYGKKRTLLKFRILELIARVPYQVWEQVAYAAITYTYVWPALARRIFDYAQEARRQQDNEQWHLLMIEEMAKKKNLKGNFLMHRIVPQFVSFFYYIGSWLLYVVKPSWSYGLNADFEDHAEHEYMLLVQENPQFENEPFDSMFKADYGDVATVADLFRQIGLDERHHKEESIARMPHARFV